MLWQTLGNYVSNVILITQGLVMVPLYIKVLGTELYGFWLASGGVLAWLSMVDVGGAAITRVRCAHAYGQGDIRRVVNYFWHGAVIMLAVIVFFLFLVLALVGSIPDLIQVEAEFQPVILDCLYITGFGSALHLAELFLRDFIFSSQRTLLPSVGILLGLIFSLISLVFGLLIFDWGLYALAFAAVVRSIIPFTCNLFVVANLLKHANATVKWSKEIFYDYRATVPSLLAAKSSGVFISQLPVILLIRWAGPEATVSYNVTMRLLDMGKQFINQPLNSLYNSSAHLFGDPAVPRSKIRPIFFKVCVAFNLSTVAAFGIYILLNEGFIHLWVSSENYLGSGFTVLAAIATYLQLRSVLYTSLIGAHGSIQISGYIGSLERIMTALLMFLLVKDYGPFAIVVPLILGPIIFQIPYDRILLQRQPEVARCLFPLQWVWIPVGVLFGVFGLCTHWWVFESWVEFILAALLLILLPGILVISLIPQLREQISEFDLRSIYK